RLEGGPPRGATSVAGTAESQDDPIGGGCFFVGGDLGLGTHRGLLPADGVLAVLAVLAVLVALLAITSTLGQRTPAEQRHRSRRRRQIVTSPTADLHVH